MKPVFKLPLRWRVRLWFQFRTTSTPRLLDYRNYLGGEIARAAANARAAGRMYALAALIRAAHLELVRRGAAEFGSSRSVQDAPGNIDTSRSSRAEREVSVDSSRSSAVNREVRP